MRIPESLVSLIDHGVVEDVIRPLMSGKEAQVYLVVSGGEPRVAKIYKEAQNRTFKNRAEYTEGRKTRNSRDQRAMAKRSRHGRAQDEAAWRSTEVDMIYRLRSAGVRVPEPHHFIDGVLIMELVQGADGNPAPRLGEMTLPAAEAKTVFDQLLREVVRMLCAGVVHGDLSDFNVLMAADGPVVIDFPQAVDASSNLNARKLLVRDVDNLYRFLERFVPARGQQQYAQEMWHLYEGGELTPTTELTGKYAASTKYVDTDAVVSLIEDAHFDERRRREAVARSNPDASAGSGRRRRRGGPPEVETVAAGPELRNEAPSQDRRPPAGPRPHQEGNRTPRREGSRRPAQGDAARPDGNRPQRPSDGGPRGGDRAPRTDRDGPRPGARDGNRPRGDSHAAPRDNSRSRPEGNRGARDANWAPREGNRQPRDGNRTPQDGNRQPRDGNRTPQDGNRQPRDGNRTPQDGNRQPRDGNRTPQDGNRQPRDGNRTPQDGNRQPRDGNTAPRDGNRGPRSGSWGPRDGNRARPEGDRGPRPHGDRPTPPDNSGGRRPPRRR